MMSSGPVAAAATAAAANAGRTTFWQTTSRATTAQDVISKHSQAGADDRNMRITVRRDYKQHGFTSNLFPVKIDPNRTIFQYRLDVDRVPREFVIPFHHQQQQQQQQQGNPDDQQNQQQLHQQMMNLPPSASSPLPPVSPTRAWRLYSQALRSSSRPLPPLLRVGSSIFSAGALPDEALTLGSEYHDKGWKKCELKLIASAPFSRLCPGDLKQVMNKMLPWALAFHARSAGASNTFNMVREIDGKMISTEDSLAVSGLRIFRGTTAAMLQINDPSSSSSGGLGGDELGIGSNGLILPNSSNNNNNNNNAFLQHLLRHTGSTLSSLNPSHERCTTVRVLVLSFTRTFHYNGKEVQVWALQDASGFGSLAIWDYDQNQSDVAIHQNNNNNNNGRNFPLLAEGMIIDISNFSLRQVQVRFRRETTPISNFEIAGSPQTVLKKIEVPPFENINNNNGVSSSSSSSSSSSTPMSISPRFKDSTTLALRLDTRCTVASEKSLLDEIKQHFGDVWPYTDDQKTRITRAVLGTPVVLSINLKHSIVRAVRFDFDSPESAPMDPHLRQLAPELQKFQPYAVVHDFSIVPLQVLHCCFDPKMRSWQQVTAPACSFFPHDRAQVLSKFRTALSQGLLQWGVTLLEQPLTSDQVTVMEKREVNPRSRQQQYQQRNTNSNTQNNNRGTSPNNQNNFQPQQQKDLPTLISITNIRSKHTSNEEMQGNEKTCTSLARYFRTNHHSTVEGEAAALMHVRRAHCLEQQQQQQPNANNSNNSNNNQNFALRDPNSVAIFLTSERDTRAARWLASECLRRGILPYFMTGISNEKRLGLLNKQTQQNLQLKFAMNPFPSSLDLGAEVPSLQGRNILMVGIDTCHTNSITTGSCVGFVVAPGNNGNFCVPTFWQNEVRGQELEQVTRHFGLVVEEARRKVPGQILHEIVVFQDGNVYAELEAMERCIPAGSRLSFLCLHKRTHIRFTFNDRKQNRHASASKGTVVRALTPVNAGSASSLDPKNNIEQNISDENQYGVVPEFSDQHHHQNQEQQNNNNNNTSQFKNPSAGSSSFFLQCHECFTSTARTVQFVVHRQSDTLPLPDLQKLTFALAHVGSPQSTKLPLPTRAAHRLSAQIERLVEASAPFRNVKIPEPLRNRCWFL